jgi:hypothetical protein
MSSAWYKANQSVPSIRHLARIFQIMVIAIWSFFFVCGSLFPSVGRLIQHAMLSGRKEPRFLVYISLLFILFLATGEPCPSPWTICTITAALVHLGIPVSSGSRRLLLVIFSDTYSPSPRVGWPFTGQTGWVSPCEDALGCKNDDDDTSDTTPPHFLFERKRPHHNTTLRYTRCLFPPPLTKMTTMTMTRRTFDDTGSASIGTCSISDIRVIMTKTREKKKKRRRKGFKSLTTR